MMRQSAAGFVRIGVLWCIACNGDDGGTVIPECVTKTPTLELGTGSLAFEALPDGADLGFYLGPQGGYHVFGSLRATGIEPGDPDDPFGPGSPLVSLVLSVDGAQVGALLEQPRLFSEEGDLLVLLGQRVVIELPDPTVLDGSPAVLSAAIEDSCGRTASDGRAAQLTLVSE